MAYILDQVEVGNDEMGGRDGSVDHSLKAMVSMMVMECAA